VPRFLVGVALLMPAFALLVAPVALTGRPSQLPERSPTNRQMAASPWLMARSQETAYAICYRLLSAISDLPVP